MARNVVDLGEFAGHITTGSGATITVYRVGSEILVKVTGEDGHPGEMRLNLTPELGAQLVTCLSGAVIRAADHQAVAGLPA